MDYAREQLHHMIVDVEEEKRRVEQEKKEAGYIFIGFHPALLADLREALRE